MLTNQEFSLGFAQIQDKTGFKSIQQLEALNVRGERAENSIICVEQNRTFLGVQDKQQPSNFYFKATYQDGTEQLVPVKRFFNLRSYFQSNNEEEVKEVQEPIDEKLKKRQQMKTLVHEFGTKKQKKRIQMQDSSNIDPNNISNLQQTQLVTQLKVKSNQKGLEQQEEQLKIKSKMSKQALLPQFSKESETKEEYYDFNSIISEQEYKEIPIKLIKTVLKEKRAHLNKSLHNYTIVAATQFDSKKKKFSSHTLKQLIPKVLRGNVSKIAEKLSFPQLIAEKILNKYSSPSVDKKTEEIKYSRNEDKNHKLILHIIVLILFIQNFEFNAMNLALALKIKLKNLGVYFKLVGCSAVDDDGKKQQSWTTKTKAKFELPQ